MTAIVIPNVFLPSTTISSTAMNANFTTVANAIQASLAIDGSVAMTGVLKGANGTAALPAFSFNTDPNIGMFRKAADELGFATNGVLAFFLDAAAKGWFSGAADVAGALTVAGATTLASTLAMSNAANRTTFAESLAQVGAGFGLQADIASAATVDLGTAPSHNVQITGTTTITSFGSTANLNTPLYLVKFGGIMTVTHSATLVLPGLANYVTAAGDCMLVEIVAAGDWRVRAIWPRNALTPNVQEFLSGSGTYVPNADVRYIEVSMVGGGGGGGAATTNNGNNGVSTNFGGWGAAQGNGGLANAQGRATGGTGASDGTGTKISRIAGQNGFSSQSGTIPGNGASSELGGGGQGQVSAAGEAAKPNTGSGGAGSSNGANAGSGGAAGESVSFYMSAAQIGAGQAYSVGAGGTGGAAGGTAGGNGAAGRIAVKEYFS